ncbi:TetR/AcrR family transcriptional regulator [Actinacidiphila yeochonensis]|uniref:TetR/AcrR family transcriptional regulator n=1 Tax=Actinacidiphila yeochonensis TaxID=89050 RepID=UPI00099D7AF7|nr:TetR/AcrR family transcriptional regulator [Actinacidiphila yeochonensis]
MSGTGQAERSGQPGQAEKPGQPGQPGNAPATAKRADVARNEEKLLAAAAEVFVTSGVDAPVREVAARAGVGMGTLYRHFPTRADLVVAVFRHQVEECAQAGPRLLEAEDSPLAALRRWIDLFVDFLATKHGLANTLQPDSSGFASLHTYFIDRLLPVGAHLLDAAAGAGEIRRAVQPYELMRGIGNLCIAPDPHYDPRRLIDLLLAGLQQPEAP